MVVSWLFGIFEALCGAVFDLIQFDVRFPVSLKIFVKTPPRMQVKFTIRKAEGDTKADMHPGPEIVRMSRHLFILYIYIIIYNIYIYIYTPCNFTYR